ncbi:VF530 family protein [Colwellia sp. 1_MG-2023]|uniref:VF530 family protein n=1 Tax=unclassified Colwellia TaxID=196834 RepID=UPI001C08875D|nr:MULTISPECIES: VF530 family protein [unclassified Colwellia]MBU2926352.1 VF530 family protein [Colwellia sp. C2M11]MDO6651790.1 VF530 family protein [Colwellia sp. 3_MG-2023]MDO6665299.1 VF530 family protein [Colwellia sp. 2_MG-2023]MDO6689672.1 VF530 family protein [Colwellia sp. 1_MG-2023]
MDNSNDPLHGVKLEQILTELEKKIGWEQMGELLNIRCFMNKPRLKSSLKFLRTTPWARSRVEILYLKTFCSKHKETGKIIRAILAQDNKVAQTTSKNPDTSKNTPFVWPTAKKK